MLILPNIKEPPKGCQEVVRGSTGEGHWFHRLRECNPGGLVIRYCPNACSGVGRCGEKAEEDNYIFYCNRCGQRNGWAW